MKVLIIEDDRFVLDSIGEILELEDFDVVKAEDGYIGCEKAVEHKPDLILCDLNMPNMNGYEVLQFVRSNIDLYNTPFIFLTARAERDDRRKGMELGADDYITKPFRQSELVSAIKVRLDRSQADKYHIQSQIKEVKLRISSVIPHSLRNPLNTIIGSTQLLLMEHKDMAADELELFLNSIYTSSIKLKRITINYLLYSELELLKLDIESAIQYKSILTELNSDKLIYYIKQKAKEYERENDLKMNIVDFKETLYINEDHLIKVLEEMLDNAFKYSPNNEIVIINLSNSQLFELEIINVCLSGTDFNVEMIESFTSKSKQDRNQTGSGMGLALTKSIMHLSQSNFSLAKENNYYVVKLGFRKA